MHGAVIATIASRRIAKSQIARSLARCRGGCAGTPKTRVAQDSTAHVETVEQGLLPSGMRALRPWG
eukprot:1649955-Alexandrium_andersonii.AAC.1